MKWIESAANGPTWVRAVGAGVACMLFATPFMLFSVYMVGVLDEGAMNWWYTQRLLVLWLLAGGAGAALLVGHDLLRSVLYRDEAEQQAGPAAVEEEQFDAAIALELGEAELEWRARGGRETPVPEAAGEGSSDLPIRPVWPSREPSLKHPTGGTQSCLHCLDEVPVPYTLCDPCGQKFASYFKEQHGIDLERRRTA